MSLIECKDANDNWLAIFFNFYNLEFFENTVNFVSAILVHYQKQALVAISPLYCFLFKMGHL